MMESTCIKWITKNKCIFCLHMQFLFSVSWVYHKLLYLDDVLEQAALLRASKNGLELGYRFLAYFPIISEIFKEKNGWENSNSWAVTINFGGQNSLMVYETVQDTRHMMVLVLISPLLIRHVINYTQVRLLVLIVTKIKVLRFLVFVWRVLRLPCLTIAM